MFQDPTVISSRTVHIRHMNSNGKIGQSFPDAVKAAVNSMATGSVRSFCFKLVTPGRKFYTSEGRRYARIQGDAVAKAEVVDSSNIGASNVLYRMGDEVPMQVGDWLVEYYWYSGMVVYHVTLNALEAKKEKQDE